MEHLRSTHRNSISRREFLRWGALAGVGFGALACAPAGTVPAQPAPGDAGQTGGQTSGAETEPAVAGQRYKEAPQLAERVRAGELPGVDERLPETPKVVEPVERIGVYGGEWRSAMVGGSDSAWLIRTMAYENLVRWDTQWTEVVPNIAESFEVNDDATEYTFHLRPGMRWSDGEPFSADDIVFWWEDVALNAELSPGGPPSWMVTGGEPGVVEKVDDYTVKFSFVEPNGFLLLSLATPDGSAPNRYPRHYLAQFHSKYNEENLDTLIEEADAVDWVNLFQLKGSGVPGTSYDARWQNMELPSLAGWTLTTGYGVDSRVVAVRNPYYWKVDPEGQQLPYIDGIVYDVLEDPEVLLLKVLNGEIDMHTRHFNTLDNKAVLTDNMAAGEYHFFDLTSTENTVAISLNLTHKDPVKREIFQNKAFRSALSHAINRQEIIDAVYVQQGEPAHTGLLPDSPIYHERLNTQFLEYDPELANQLLDEAGYTERDGEGYRLGPDGKRITIVIEGAEGHRPDWADVGELTVEYWKAVGIDAQLRLEDRSLLYTRKEANDHDATVWSSAAGGQSAMLDPRFYFPYSNESNFAIAWATWYRDPASPIAEEPPAAVQKQMELYDQLKATADQAM